MVNTDQLVGLVNRSYIATKRNAKFRRYPNANDIRVNASVSVMQRLPSQVDKHEPQFLNITASLIQ